MSGMTAEESKARVHQNMPGSGMKMEFRRKPGDMSSNSQRHVIISGIGRSGEIAGVGGIAYRIHERRDQKGLRRVPFLFS